MSSGVSHYTVLGLTPGATDQEIRQAYKRLALRFHPEKNDSPQARDRFNQISSAYVALINPEISKEYEDTPEADGSSSTSSSQKAQRRDHFFAAMFDAMMQQQNAASYGGGAPGTAASPSSASASSGAAATAAPASSSAAASHSSSSSSSSCGNPNCPYHSTGYTPPPGPRFHYVKKHRRKAAAESREAAKPITMPAPTITPDLHSVHAAWAEPQGTDGHEFADNLSFQLEMRITKAWQLVYEGDDNEYEVPHLLPGTRYSFRLRMALGDVKGPWSDITTVTTPGVRTTDAHPPVLSNLALEKQREKQRRAEQQQKKKEREEKRKKEAAVSCSSAPGAQGSAASAAAAKAAAEKAKQAKKDQKREEQERRRQEEEEKKRQKLLAKQREEEAYQKYIEEMRAKYERERAEEEKRELERFERLKREAEAAAAAAAAAPKPQPPHTADSSSSGAGGKPSAAADSSASAPGRGKTAASTPAPAPAKAAAAPAKSNAAAKKPSSSGKKAPTAAPAAPPPAARLSTAEAEAQFQARVREMQQAFEAARTLWMRREVEKRKVEAQAAAALPAGLLFPWLGTGGHGGTAPFSPLTAGAPSLGFGAVSGPAASAGMAGTLSAVQPQLGGSLLAMGPSLLGNQ